MEEDLIAAVGTIRGKPLRRMEVFSKMVCEYGRSRFGESERPAQKIVEKKVKTNRRRKKIKELRKEVQRLRRAIREASGEEVVAVE